MPKSFGTQSAATPKTSFHPFSLFLGRLSARDQGIVGSLDASLIPDWRTGWRPKDLDGHLSIEIYGVLRGAADGPLAVAALALVVLAITARLRGRR